MADTGIFCTTAEVLRKAGAGASATSSAEAYTNDFVTQAESYINAVTRHNWSDDYASLNVDVKGILKEAASNLAAIYVVMYDKSGYNSNSEADIIIAICWNRFLQCMEALMDEKVQTFISGA